MSMHRSFVPLALLALLATAAVTSAQDRGIATSQVIVQGALGDVVLNSILAEAIVNEPACKDAVQAIVASPVSIVVEMPVAHLAGTYQLAIHMNLTGPKVPTLSAEQGSKAVDTVVAHLRTRLDGMLFVEPREQLRARCDELQRQHRDLQVRHVELRARADAAAANHVAAKRVHGELQSQCAAAQLELAVEERARDQLERLRTQHDAARAACNERRDEIVSQSQQAAGRSQELQTLVADLGRQANPDKDRLAKLQEELRERTAHAQSLGRVLDETNGKVADVMRMLTVVLEQIPTNALAVQRARARVEVLVEQTARAAKELDETEAKRREAAAITADAEQAGIELAVIKTLLLELQGKLTRLQPPTYTVLRQ